MSIGTLIPLLLGRRPDPIEEARRRHEANAARERAEHDLRVAQRTQIARRIQHSGFAGS